MKHITEIFYAESRMNSYISQHGILRNNITFMGPISDNKYQLSYWIDCYKN